MSITDVLVNVEIQRLDMPHHQTGFGDILYSLRRCSHDIDLFFTVKMTSSQWKHVAAMDETFVIFQAEMKGSVLDVTGKGSGVLASPHRRLVEHGEEALVSCELFAGGFSGWAHALRRLCDLGWKLDHKFAVEIDADCIDTYMKSHDFKHRCGPMNFHWENDDKHLYTSIYIYTSILYIYIHKPWDVIAGTSCLDKQKLTRIACSMILSIKPTAQPPKPL